MWRDFTAKNKMVWPQYLDKDRHIQRAFGVHAFPTYIVIDHEGIIRYQSIGLSWQRSASLGDAVGKLVKSALANLPASGRSAAAASFDV